MTNREQPFKFFASCFPVAGSNRGIICDLQRKSYHFIPLGLYEVFIQHENKTINEIKEFYTHEYDEILEEYFNFLQNEEYIFFTETPELFPKMNLEWDEPSWITNAIIDVGKAVFLNWNQLISEFETLACKHIQIRCFSDKNLEFFEDILKKCEDSRIVSIELVIKYQLGFDKRLLFDFCNKYPRIFCIYIHSAPKTETLYLSSQGMGHIFFTQEIITSESHCGIVSPNYFSINIKTFTEAQLHNTCLNRKIAIDVDGNIKNCPSMPYSYGNIKDTTLREALEHPDFKKYWYIHKDQIEVCKDCEFRYICTDCRAYLEDPDNLYSKPLKCGYNPYTCEWEEWSTNPLKQKAIEYYGMQELVKQEPEEPRERATK